ncbi:MAG TPA: DUF2066 domain-containing protein [Alphaproteobacteria bacterium]|jgi:hypothetical protein|nr:DUF2066 domain-containing protein [Alphaproteobacteria bacterium]
MSGRLRGLAAGLALFAAWAAAPAAAVEVKDVYKAETIVTGTGEAERQRGFRETLAEVLVKASGDATLLGSDRLARAQDHAAEFVASYEQEDRMKGMPIHDEQGTRDRPFYLRVTFDKAKIDALLHTLGRDPWPTDRPAVAVWLGIQDAVTSYVLTETSERGYGQREALRSASRRRGVPILLPGRDVVARDGVTYAAIAGDDRATLGAASADLGAQAMLFGTLDYDGKGYWMMDWAFARGDAVRRWRQEHVTFDVALRGGLEGAARALAGLP